MDTQISIDRHTEGQTDIGTNIQIDGNMYIKIDIHIDR